MTKKEYLELFIKDAELMIEELRKYCHYKKCKRDIYECPQCCCKEKLGLDTAMAWKCADEINCLIYNMGTFTNKSFGKHRKELQYHIDILYDNTDILVFHHKKYKELRGILYDIRMTFIRVKYNLGLVGSRLNYYTNIKGEKQW